MESLFCPGCGSNADSSASLEIEGFFSPHTYIFRCEECDALVQDGQWLSYREAQQEFRR